MAVNLSRFSEFLPVAGVRLGVAQSAMRYQNRDDLVIIELAEGSQCAGVFTRNAFCAAPVSICRQHLQDSSPRYLMINTGNANAGTGQAGYNNTVDSCHLLAAQGQCELAQVLPFSTGVIGEPLNMSAFERGIPLALADLDEGHWHRAAAGIMTTDTIPKGYSRELMVEGHSVRITGISKGAGMIKPDMATMLGFIATDADISAPVLQRWCRQLADSSFNRITIDGDTSTNDCCMLIATGKSGLRIDDDNAAGADELFAALKAAFQQLAQAIVRDGEGATKFVTLQVNGATEPQEALDVAYCVAHSPLVKTAWYASDANWGRILAAVGRVGLQDLDVSNIQIFLDDVQIVADGGRCVEYTEEAGAAVLSGAEFCVRIELGRGQYSDTLWTSDLSHEYVSINADYRS